MARKLWEYLIKQEDVREMFIHNLFSDKVCVCVCVCVCVRACVCVRIMHSASHDTLILQNTSNSQDAGSTILYKDIDGEVSTFCLNSVISGWVINLLFMIIVLG